MAKDKQNQPKPKTKAQRNRAAEQLDKALDADKVVCPVGWCKAEIGRAAMADHMLIAHGIG